MRVCVLGSGSGGNSTVVRLGDDAMLIDAGFGPVRTARWLINAKLRLAQVRAVCLTHLDRDHFRPHWVATLVGFGIRVYVHRWHLPDLQRVADAAALEAAGLLHPFDGQPFEPMPGLRVESVSLPHDRKGTSGFLLSTKAGRMAYATDVGRVSDQVVQRFAGVDLLAIECNYDPDLQRDSSRPAFLKARIMGGKGHLSNHEAFDAVRRIADLSPQGNPQHVVLLHRSAQCNRPALVRQVFDQDPAIAARTTLTQQRRRTRWFSVRRLKTTARGQMTLGARV